MATIEPRTTKDGQTRYRVKWRDGGRRDGDWESDTFDSYTAARRYKSLVEANGHHRPVAPEVTAKPHETGVVRFGAWARQCIEDRPLDNGYTRHRYVRAFELHIEPHLGDRPVAEITRAELASWQRALLGKGLSAKSVNNCRAVASMALRAACREGDDGQPTLRASNPLDGLPQPRVILKPPTLLETQEHVSIFLTCAYEIQAELGDLLLVKLAGGFRYGELAPLKSAALTSRQEVQVLDVRRLDEHGNVVVVEDAKSEAGFGRRMPMADVAWKVLSKRAEGLARKELLFSSPWGRRMWSYSTVHNGFTRALA